MIDRRGVLLGGVVLAGCASTGVAGGNARGRRLSATDLEDALVGSSYLGCGGGGSLAEARELIAEDLAVGRVFRAMPVEALRDGERVACPYALGSIAPDANAPEPVVEHVTEASFRLLEEHLGTTFGAVILGEIGPLSLAEGLSIAARLGVPALDADTVGRAVPEINQHSVRVSGESLLPASGVTSLGDRVVLSAVADPSRPEEVFRALSVAGGGTVGVVDSPLTGRVAKRPGVLVRDSLSLAMRIGRAAREAKAAGGDAVEAARAAGDGYTLFRGRVADWDWRDENGFLKGTVTLEGDGGSRMVLDYINEHLVATLDGEVVATCPDLITVVDERTAEGVGNPDFERGQAVSVLGFRCDPIWRTPAGLEVFRPRYFGFDVSYIPIETRLEG